jgi:hypothetical protein
LFAAITTCGGEVAPKRPRLRYGAFQCRNGTKAGEMNPAGVFTNVPARRSARLCGLQALLLARPPKRDEHALQQMSGDGSKLFKRAATASN